MMHKRQNLLVLVNVALNNWTRCNNAFFPCHRQAQSYAFSSTIIIVSTLLYNNKNVPNKMQQKVTDEWHKDRPARHDSEIWARCEGPSCELLNAVQLTLAWDEVDGRVELHVWREDEVGGGGAASSVSGHIDGVQQLLLLPVGGDVLPLGRVHAAVCLALYQLLRAGDLRGGGCEMRASDLITRTSCSSWNTNSAKCCLL